MKCLNFRDVTTLPLSLWRKKIQIIRMKEMLGLPRGFFFE
jgi:hypothetical protein